MTQFSTGPGQPTPPANYGTPGDFAPKQSNGMALTGLIFGIVGFCIPFLGGLLALLFGFLGFRRSKTTRSGAGLAITGMILGLLSLGVWALGGTGIFALIKGTQVNRDAAKQFVQDLTGGNVAAATADTDGSIPQDRLQSLSDGFKAHGSVTDVTCPTTSVVNGVATVVGVVTFSDNAKQVFTMQEVKSADGKWKVSDAQLNKQQ